MTTLDYLVPFLRFKIGDVTAPYRYLDEWLVVSLNYALRLSYRYLKNKYVIDLNDNVTRNPLTMFDTDELLEGTIERQDEPILVILASLSTLNGSLENSAWDFTSWKDAEISYNANESSRTRSSSLDRLNAELEGLIGNPSKRLARGRKASLPGYHGNDREYEGKY